MFIIQIGIFCPVQYFEKRQLPAGSLNRETAGKYLSLSAQIPHLPGRREAITFRP